MRVNQPEYGSDTRRAPRRTEQEPNQQREDWVPLEPAGATNGARDLFMYVVPHQHLKVVNADSFTLTGVGEPASNELCDGIAVDLRVALGVGERKIAQPIEGAACCPAAVGRPYDQKHWCHHDRQYEHRNANHARVALFIG